MLGPASLCDSGFAGARFLDAVGRGELSVAFYRLYFMNPRNGHIERFESIAAEGDAAAMMAADAHQGRQPMELWCGGRKVARFEAVLPSPPPKRAA